MKAKEVVLVSAVATLTMLALDAVKREVRHGRQKRTIREKFGIRRGENFEQIGGSNE